VKTISVLLATALLVCATNVTAKHHRQYRAEVVHISEEYGNIETNATAAALEEIGLSAGDSFPVGFDGKEVRVYLGTTYSDVPRGDWVAFITEAGNLRLARNFENAATTLGVEVGDTLVLYN